VRAREEILEQTAGVRAQLASYEADVRRSEKIRLRTHGPCVMICRAAGKASFIAGKPEAEKYGDSGGDRSQGKDAAETAAQIDGLKNGFRKSPPKTAAGSPADEQRTGETQEKNRELLDLERECARLEQKNWPRPWKKNRLWTSFGTPMN
jgi:hypothetical protein